MSEEEELIDLIYYRRSTMHEETTVNIYNSILEIVRNAIKEVTIEYNRPGKYYTHSMSAKVFIPSSTEITGNGLYINYDYLYIGEQLAIFTDNASRTKNDMSRYGTGKAASWWTRTIYGSVHDAPDGHYMYVPNDGNITGAAYPQTVSIGAVFCFNI